MDYRDSKENARRHAARVLDELNAVRNQLSPGLSEEGDGGYPVATATAMLSGACGILHQMSLGSLVFGQSQIANYVVDTVKVLEKSGGDYQNACQKLIGVMSLIYQHGLAIDDFGFERGRQDLPRKPKTR